MFYDNQSETVSGHKPLSWWDYPDWKAIFRQEWKERAAELQLKQARILLRSRPNKKGSPRKIGIKFGKLFSNYYDPEVAREVDLGRVILGGAEYRQTTGYAEVNQGCGTSIFYASEDSCTPYLIIIWNEHFVTEYQFLSVTAETLPASLYLRLSQAILSAHQKGIVLGPDLNLNNIKWDISNDKAGLPVVTFKNLPPPATDNTPRPPPKWPIPGLSDSSGATEASDIYSTPSIISQMIFRIEDCIKGAMKTRSEEGPKEMVSTSVPTRAIFVTRTSQLPRAARANHKLVAIANACLSHDPASRPTAKQLVKKLKHLVHFTIARDLARFSLSCGISFIRNNMFLSSEC